MSKKYLGDTGSRVSDGDREPPLAHLLAQSKRNSPARYIIDEPYNSTHEIKRRNPGVNPDIDHRHEEEEDEIEYHKNEDEDQMVDALDQETNTYRKGGVVSHKKPLRRASGGPITLDQSSNNIGSPRMNGSNNMPSQQPMLGRNGAGQYHQAPAGYHYQQEGNFNVLEKNPPVPQMNMGNQPHLHLQGNLPGQPQFNMGAQTNFGDNSVPNPFDGILNQHFTGNPHLNQQRQQQYNQSMNTNVR